MKRELRLKVSKQSIVTQQFFKDLFQLSKKEQKQVANTIKLMEQDITHPPLNCHAVKGTPYYEVYVNMDIRIIFEFNEDLYVLFRAVHHDMLDKL